MFCIYRDLLSGDPSYKMEVKMKSEGGLHVPGLCSEEVKSVDDVNQVGMVWGQSNQYQILGLLIFTTGKKIWHNLFDVHVLWHFYTSQ